MKRVIDILLETVREWNEHKATRLAATLAYYTVFSLTPFLVVVTALVGLVFGREAVQGRIVEQFQGLVGSQGARMIEDLLRAAYQPSASFVATVIGIGVLILGAAGTFIELQDALNTVWETGPRQGSGILQFLRDRLVSFILVLGVGFLLLVSLAISAGLAALDHFIAGSLPGWQAILGISNFAVSFGVITLLFAILFKYLPDIRIEWRDVWLGALVTALLFNIGKFALGLYLGRSAIASAYGAAGSLVVILVWVYYSAQILLLGAEFTRVYARRYGSHFQPDLKRLRPDTSKTWIEQRSATPGWLDKPIHKIPI